MAITFPSLPAAANAASITLPAHAPGDLLIIIGYCPGNTSPPAAPAAGGTVPAWNTVDASGANSFSSLRSAWAVATDNNHTSGTWTGFGALTAIVLRGAKNSSPIGGHATQGGNSSPVTAPNITPVKTDGSSMFLYFHGQGEGSNGTTAWSATAAGFTNRLAQNYGMVAVCVNTKDDTHTASALSQSSGSSAWWQATTMEIIAADNSGQFFAFF